MFSSLRFSFSLLLLGGVLACSTPSGQAEQAAQERSTRATAASVDVQGHRGARGHFPENSIPGFLAALDMGATTLEMDAVISQDGKVLLSHEPFLSHQICLNAEGEPISEEEEKNYNLYQMTYAEIKACDCGTPQHAGFPEQQHMKTYKPLLAAVVDSVQAYCQRNGRQPPAYNIETKSSPAGDEIFHPRPAEFVDLLMEVVNAKGIQARTTLQSFDVRSLQHAHTAYPEVQLALLVGNRDGAAINLNRLGFVPEIYSPYYQLVDEALLALCEEKGMQLIPWTVNEAEDIQRMLSLGVDGIISDYPDRVVAALNE